MRTCNCYESAQAGQLAREEPFQAPGRSSCTVIARQAAAIFSAVLYLPTKVTECGRVEGSQSGVEVVNGSWIIKGSVEKEEM
jgi:hypothetical protein